MGSRTGGVFISTEISIKWNQSIKYWRFIMNSTVYRDKRGQGLEEYLLPQKPTVDRKLSRPTDPTLTGGGKIIF